MSTVCQVLLACKAAEVLPSQMDGKSGLGLAFKDSDSIGFVLNHLAESSAVSALVVKAAALADVPNDEGSRAASNVQMRDIIGFVDLNIILHSLLRGVHIARLQGCGACMREAPFKRCIATSSTQPATL